MRVLIPIGMFYPSKLGGPSRTLYWMAKGLISEGVGISVVTSSDFIDEGKVDFDKWIKVDNIRVRYCTTKYKIKLIWHSIKELRNCDLVILTSFLCKFSFFLALYTTFTSKKIIWSPRGELFDSAINGSRLKLLYFRILKYMYRKRVVFHATSIEEQYKILEYFGDDVKSFIVPNYLELPKKQIREPYEKYFLFVGRIAPIKALDNLLLGLLKSKTFIESDYKLIIAGGVQKQYEGFYEQLKTIVQNNESIINKVVFVGNVEGEVKYKLFANAYFTILVSHSENFGNVVVESLSQGTPVIASTGTPWKILVEKKAGFWVNINEDEIARCVDEALFMNTEKYYHFRENSYKLAKEFDVYSNIDKWIKQF